MKKNVDQGEVWVDVGVDRHCCGFRQSPQHPVMWLPNIHYRLVVLLDYVTVWSSTHSSPWSSDNWLNKQKQKQEQEHIYSKQTHGHHGTYCNQIWSIENPE